MFYEYAITVDANTTEAEPNTQSLKLAHGIIQRIEVQFPIGTRALTHCRLTHHTFGQLPSNKQGSFATDGYIIEVTSPIEFFKAPYSVKAICWNDDDTYPHTITLRFDIVESKPVLFMMSVLKGMAKMLNLMGIKV